ncbi:hypothetical protein GCM10010388_06430 [Streptomyces mauvecolor]
MARGCLRYRSRTILREFADNSPRTAAGIMPVGLFAPPGIRATRDLPRRDSDGFGLRFRPER